MKLNIDGKIMDLVQCEKCSAMKLEGKQCSCEKEQDE